MPANKHLWAVFGLPASILAILLAACSSQSAESLIASGKELSARKDHNGAAIQYKAALQIDPRSSEARILLGKALLDLGDVVGARTELTKALDDKAATATVVPLLTNALLLAGEYKQLVTAYGGLVLEDKAAQAALKANVATAWGALGDRANTEAAVAAALAAVPDHGPGLILKARLLAGKREFDAASALVDQVLARNERFHEAWLLRGELLEFHKKDIAAAEAAYRKAIEIEKAYVPAYSAVIASRVRQRDIAGAKALAAQLRGVVPHHPFTVLVDAQLAYLDRQSPRARELIQQLLRVFPDQQGILLLAGAIESELGAVVQAAAYFAKVVQLNPSMEVARRSLAEAEIRLGQHAKALETLKPLLADAAPSAAVLALAGDAELRLGNAAAAEAHFVRAARTDPSNIRIQAAAAMTRLWSGDADAALNDLQAMSAKTQDTYADEALFAARMKRREFDAALAALDAMDKKQPGKAAQMEMRGRVHIARRDVPAARRAFEEALKLDPAMFAAVSSLALLDIHEGRRDQAVARLEASVKADPKNWVALMALAEMKAREGAPVAEVKKLLGDAITASPSSPGPRLRLIEFAMRKRLFKDALTAAQDALAALPGDVAVLDAVGRAQMQAGDVEQAATTFRKLASAVPTAPEPYMKLAEVYLAGGKRDQAETAINKALELAPGYAAAQSALVDLLVSTNRQRNALAYIERVKQVKSRAAMGYSLEAGYHVRLKNNDAAIAALRGGIDATDHPELARKLYSLLWQVGKTAEADKFAAAWMKRHPGDAAFEYQLAATDITRGSLKTAEERLNRVVGAYPTNAMALNNLAYVLVKNGGRGAVGYAQRAVDLLPDQPPLMDTLAMALAADKQVAQALDVQKRAVELSPKDSGMRMNLARIALQAGDKALAREALLYLQQQGAAYPGQAEVTKLLQGL